MRIAVLAGVSFAVDAGECVVLGGPSGAGKSSILRMAYGNYAVDSGEILVAHGGETVDLAAASPRTVLALRRDTIGYVSQFLRTVPRVAALDVVAEPLLSTGATRDEARELAAALLRRLNLPERLWQLPPATFSGGEQQRVNIARGFVTAHPILLLDEPTASLDAENRAVVIELVREKKQARHRAARHLPRCRRPPGGGRQGGRRHRLRAARGGCMSALANRVWPDGSSRSASSIRHANRLEQFQRKCERFRVRNCSKTRA